MKILILILLVGVITSCAGKTQKSTLKVESADELLTPDGSLNEDAIRNVVMKNQESVKACYSKELKIYANLEGKVMFEWVIGEGGKAANAKVLSTELKNPQVEQCILKELKTWNFPAPPAGKELVVKYPIGFHSR